MDLRIGKIAAKSCVIGAMVCLGGALANAQVVYSQNFDSGTSDSVVPAATYWNDPTGAAGNYTGAITKSSGAAYAGIFGNGIPVDAGGSGYFLFEGTGNPTTVGTIIFQSPTFAVAPNTNYTISFYLTNEDGISPASLQPQIGAQLLGAPVSAAGTYTTNGWQKFSFTWNSGANFTASLIINDLNMNTTGNDFGVDAISVVGPATDTGFQVRYAANLNVGESYVDITNTGANGAALQGPGFGTQAGNICVNAYAFDPSEELVSCCSCLVTPDQTVNLGVVANLTSKTLTGVVPTSVTVKLLATLAGAGGSGTGSICNNSAATATAAAVIPAGLAAWGTTLHAQGAGTATTETAFTGAMLSAGELASITGRCAAIIGNASGFGICASCRTGALGGSKL